MTKTQKKPHILLTNDDGYQCSGINILFEALCQYFQVTIAAPKTNQSGSSHKITLKKPLAMTTYKKGYIIDGTTVDAVYLALSEEPIEGFDLVVSGINEGANLGDDFHYSATIAGAREAAFYGKPAIALSMINYNEATAQAHATFIAKKIAEKFQNFKPGVLYSINFPQQVSEHFSLCSLGRRARTQVSCEKFTPSSQPTWCWIGPLEKGLHSDDFAAVLDGKISYTCIDYNNNRLGEYLRDSQVLL